jgi:hypothetical protein
VDAWVGSMHHPLPWLPPKLVLKLHDLSISFEDFSVFCEFFLFLKLKSNSLCSLLGFSFYENLTTKKIKQEWQ